MGNEIAVASLPRAFDSGTLKFADVLIRAMCSTTKYA